MGRRVYVEFEVEETSSKEQAVGYVMGILRMAFHHIPMDCLGYDILTKAEVKKAMKVNRDD